MKIEINDFLNVDKCEYGVWMHDKWGDNKIYLVYEQVNKLITALQQIMKDKENE